MRTIIADNFGKINPAFHDSFHGKAVKYSEAERSVVLGEADFPILSFSFTREQPSVGANSDNTWPELHLLSEANFRDVAISHYEKNSLNGARTFSRLESTQRKILKNDFEKTKKEDRIKGFKKIKTSNLGLKPYYQIQTCPTNNSHFARPMILCSCNDHVNCNVCRAKRMRRLQRVYLPALLEYKNPKLLTLTLRRSGINLDYDLEKLGSCLTKIKRSKDWKDHISHYFGSKEIVEGNVHAHIVVDGSFWDQAEISKLWGKITGDSCIVDIRKINNPEKAIKEVFKYLVKDTNKKTLEEVSLFRKANPNTRFVFSSKGLSKLGVCEATSEFDEAFDEGELLHSLEGEAENSSSLDTIAISGQKLCPCCKDRLILLGDFESKEEAEAESRRILAGNQYKRRWT